MPDLIKVNEALNAKQYKALELYASGRNQEEICTEIGVQPSTLRNWIATNQNFRSTLKQHMSSYLTVSNVFLGATYEKAIKKLSDLLDNEELEPMQILKIVDSISRITKNAVDMEKSDTETEVNITQITEKGPDDKVLSVTEQKNILRRIRGDYGSEQILEGKSTEVQPNR